MNHFIRTSICLLAVTLAATARADTFNFTASGSTFSASGSLSATPDLTIPGAFDVTSFTGTLTIGASSQAITGLLACASYSPSAPCSSSGPDSFLYADLLYPSGVPPLDIQVIGSDGIGFTTGSIEGEFYASSSHIDTLTFNTQPGDATALTGVFSVTPTPEPGTGLLLATGLLGVVTTLRRRLVH